MYENDTHAAKSVDVSLYSNMIMLNSETKSFLYQEYTDFNKRFLIGSRPYLENVVYPLISIDDSVTIRNIINYCRLIVESCCTRDEDMVFGGTEEEIIERSTYWCTDIARVACVLIQIAGFPSRLLITANTNFPYCGHTVVEVFYKNKWGVVDPTNGIVIVDYKGVPSSAWEIQRNHSLVDEMFSRKYPERQDFFPPGEQYESVAVVNYYAIDHVKHNYAKSKLNDYYKGILSNGWKDGLRWIFGEDTTC